MEEINQSTTMDAWDPMTLNIDVGVEGFSTLGWSGALILFSIYGLAFLFCGVDTHAHAMLSCYA